MSKISVATAHIKAPDALAPTAGETQGGITLVPIGGEARAVFTHPGSQIETVSVTRGGRNGNFWSTDRIGRQKGVSVSHRCPFRQICLGVALRKTPSSPHDPHDR